MNAHTPTDTSSPAPVDANRASRKARLAWLTRGFGAVGAAVAAWYCYGFGTQLGGVLLGVVAAANGVVLGSLLAGTLADSVVRRLLRA